MKTQAAADGTTRSGRRSYKSKVEPSICTLADLYFWRDNAGHEVDVLYETPAGLQAIEIKSGSTFAGDWVDAAGRWAAQAGSEALPPWLIYGGSGRYARQGCEVAGWREFALATDK